MRHLAFSLALLLAGAVPTLAFDADSQAVLDRMKAGKLVHVDDVATLMMGSERWCYNERDAACGWTDIYLVIEGDEATYEISNAWNEAVTISFVDHGQLRDNRYICETGFDWVPSVRAYSREDGSPLNGRALEALRMEIRGYVSPADNSDCFDYVFEGVDRSAQTVTLLQRQYDSDGVTDTINDTPVTLHFDQADADALDLYW